VTPTQGVADLWRLDVAQGSCIPCPRCQFVFAIGIHFRNVQFSGNAINIAMTCPRCGHHFDAAGEGEVRVSTGPDGGLRVSRAVRIATRQALKDNPTPAELAALVTALQEATEGSTSIEDAIARIESFPRLEAWVRNNPALARVIGSILVIVLTALATRVLDADPPPAPAQPIDVHIEQPSEEALQQIIDEALRQAQEPPPHP
jgi:hypothetical protein